MYFRFIAFIFLSGSISTYAQAPAPDEPPPAASAVEMDRFVVIGELDRARESLMPSLGATSYEVGNAQLLGQSQGLDASFNQTLLRVPGMAQDSFGQIHLRGEHANLQYRLNDVLLPEGISGFGQELDTRFIDTVSILTGSLPAQYGFRTAGIIDLHTKNGGRVAVSDVSLYGGSFNTFRPSFETGGTVGQLDYYVTGSYDSNDLGIENPTPSANAIHDHTSQLKGFGYFSYLFDTTSRVNFILSASTEKFEIPNSPDQQPAYNLNGRTTFDSTQLQEKQREDNGYAIVSYQKNNSDSGLQLSAFTRGSSVKYTPDAIGDLIFNGVASQVDRSVTTDGLEGDARWAVNDRHTLRAGFLLTYDRSKGNNSSAVFPVDSAGNQSSTTPITTIDNQRKNGGLYGMYLQDEWSAASKLTVNYGVRADGVSAYVHEGQVSPRLNLVYAQSNNTSYHIGYARYFTPPPLELVSNGEIANFAGTTNAPEVPASSPVRSERSDYFDAGISEQITPDLSLTIDSYYKHAKEQLDEGQFGQALVFSPFNYARARVYGLEVGASYSHENFSAYFDGAVSRAMAEQITSGEFQFAEDEIAYIADHYVHLDHDQHYTASGGVSYKFGKTLAYADIIYGSGLRRGFANTQKSPSYDTINTGIEHSFSFGTRRSLKLRLDVVNLFDKIYELRDGSGIGVGAPQYGARRGFYGGISWNF